MSFSVVHKTTHGYVNQEIRSDSTRLDLKQQNLQKYITTLQLLLYSTTYIIMKTILTTLNSVNRSHFFLSFISRYIAALFSLFVKFKYWRDKNCFKKENGEKLTLGF